MTRPFPRQDIVWSANVDACCLPLDVEDSCYQVLFGTLSIEERARAQRFRRMRDGCRYVVRRGRLRELLGARLGCRPQHVRLGAGRYGKPVLEGADLAFNISHSNGYALYVFSPDAEVGCDLESLPNRLATDATAALVLSPAELEAWHRTAERSRSELFLRYWTCKEAYLKARGVGLEPPLKSITVSADDPLRLLALPGDEPSLWSLAILRPTRDHVAAIAVRAPAVCVRMRAGGASNRNGAELSLRAAR